MEEEFRRLAETLISTMAAQGVALGYDDESVEWVEGFIERQRPRFGGQEAAGLINVIGSFVGECVIANYGGRWRQGEDGQWGVHFGGGDAAFPFAKVAKQFENGVEGGDSVHSFYRTISVLFKGANDAQ